MRLPLASNQDLENFMAVPNGDELANMLADGWIVAGYSVCMMAAGALAHNILLQKDNSLRALIIGTSGENEVARQIHSFAPSQSESSKKKGFWG